MGLIYGERLTPAVNVTFVERLFEMTIFRVVAFCHWLAVIFEPKATPVPTSELEMKARILVQKFVPKMGTFAGSPTTSYAGKTVMV